jgi:hypothetical protein
MNPPSSHINTLSGTAHIRATINSAAMTSMLDLCAKLFARMQGSVLIVTPEDALELDSFVHVLAEKISTAEPFIVEAGSASLLPSAHLLDYCHKERGVFLRQAGVMTEVMRQQLNLLAGNLEQPKLAIARFSSIRACSEGMALWLEAAKKMFGHRPLIWPSLDQRLDDFDGLVGSICTHLAEQNGTPREIPVLTDQAMLQLRSQRCGNVAALYRSIQRAFAKTRGEKRIAIQPIHLRPSEPPRQITTATPSA